MDDLIKLVSQKAGISEDIAKVAVETVVSFMKDKLPAPIAGQLEGILSGDVDAENLLGGLSGNAKGGLGGILGGIFGKK